MEHLEHEGSMQNLKSAHQKQPPRTTLTELICTEKAVAAIYITNSLHTPTVKSSTGICHCPILRIGEKSVRKMLFQLVPFPLSVYIFGFLLTELVTQQSSKYSTLISSSFQT